MHSKTSDPRPEKHAKKDIRGKLRTDICRISSALEKFGFSLVQLEEQHSSKHFFISKAYLETSPK